MVSKLRILVTGSREWTDDFTIYKALKAYTKQYKPSEITVVHGDHWTGADALADRAARRLGMQVEPHPADWGRGRRAGPERNSRMVEAGADICLGFPEALSRGTLDCMTKARDAGITVINLGDNNVWTD